MVLINGECKELIEFTDRGLQYGDGLFETIAVKYGKPQFLDRHLQRLTAGCLTLLIPPPDNKLLEKEVRAIIKGSDQAVVKIIITRGSGGRGYRQPDVIQPTRIVSLYPYPDYPPSLKQQGIATRFCVTRLGLNSTLAGVKHLNRLEQVLARAEWNDPETHEGIMFDNDGNVIEGTMTNIFYAKRNVLYTPILDKSGVAGIIRSIVIAQSTHYGMNVVEVRTHKDELLSAEEVFVCNSVIGIWPVRKIENQHFLVGPCTRQLQELLEHFEYEALPI